MRRKKKVTRKASNMDDKKLKNNLKRIEASGIAGIEEVFFSFLVFCVSVVFLRSLSVSVYKK